MIKIVCLSLLVSASAFVTAPRTKTTALKAFETEVGVQPPLGYVLMILT